LFLFFFAISLPAFQVNSLKIFKRAGGKANRFSARMISPDLARKNAYKKPPFRAARYLYDFFLS